MAIYVVLFAVVALVAVALVILFLADRLPGMAPATHDEVPRPPLSTPITAADLAQAQFSVRVRGYDMEEVDILIDTLVDQLAAAESHATGGYVPVRPTPASDTEASVDAADEVTTHAEPNETTLDHATTDTQAAETH